MVENLQDYKFTLHDFHKEVHAFLKDTAKRQGCGPGTWPEWLPQLELTMQSMVDAVPEMLE